MMIVAGWWITWRRYDLIFAWQAVPVFMAFAFLGNCVSEIVTLHRR
jgi:hypothetical protein